MTKRRSKYTKQTPKIASLVALTLLTTSIWAAKPSLDTPIRIPLQIEYSKTSTKPTTQSTKPTEHYFFSAYIPFNFDPKAPNSTNNVSVSVDPNYGYILVPAKTKTKQGIQCSPNTPPANSSCSYSNSSNIDNNYWKWIDSFPKGFKGASTWSWSPELSAPDVKSSTEIGLLTSPGEEWVLDNFGVLGLSPASSFWSYLNSQYTVPGGKAYASFYITTKETLFWYEVFDNSQKDAILGSELRISSNLSRIVDANTTDLSAGIKANPGIWVENKGSSSPSTSAAWQIDNVEVWSSDQNKPVLNGSVCFTTNSNATFLVRDVANFTQEANLAVCRGFNCGEDSKLLNGATYSLRLTDRNGKRAEISVRPNEYIYKDTKGVVQVSVDSLANHLDGGCSANSAIGLGRMFFFFHQVVFEKDFSGGAAGTTGSAIGVYRYQTRPSLAKFGDVDSLVFCGISFVMFLFLATTLCRLKGMLSKNMDFVEEDDKIDSVEMVNISINGSVDGDVEARKETRKPAKVARKAQERPEVVKAKSPSERTEEGSEDRVDVVEDSLAQPVIKMSDGSHGRERSETSELDSDDDDNRIL